MDGIEETNLMDMFTPSPPSREETDQAIRYRCADLVVSALNIAIRDPGLGDYIAYQAEVLRRYIMDED